MGDLEQDASLVPVILARIDSLSRRARSFLFMDFVAKLTSSKKYLVTVIVVVLVAGFGVGVWAHEMRHSVETVTNSQHQVTQLSYSGKNGINAFTLLQQHAQVGYKHYSFGNFVTSIDGVVGNGPKYWTLYVNGRQSNVGASAYITKNSDTITWELQ